MRSLSVSVSTAAIIALCAPHTAAVADCEVRNVAVVAGLADYFFRAYHGANTAQLRVHDDRNDDGPTSRIGALPFHIRHDSARGMRRYFNDINSLAPETLLWNFTDDEQPSASSNSRVMWGERQTYLAKAPDVARSWSIGGISGGGSGTTFVDLFIGFETDGVEVKGFNHRGNDSRVRDMNMATKLEGVRFDSPDFSRRIDTLLVGEGNALRLQFEFDINRTGKLDWVNTRAKGFFHFDAGGKPTRKRTASARRLKTMFEEVFVDGPAATAIAEAYEHAFYSSLVFAAAGDPQYTTLLHYQGDSEGILDSIAVRDNATLEICVTP